MTVDSTKYSFTNPLPHFVCSKFPDFVVLSISLLVVNSRSCELKQQVYYRLISMKSLFSIIIRIFFLIVYAILYTSCFSQQLLKLMTKAKRVSKWRLPRKPQANFEEWQSVIMPQTVRDYYLPINSCTHFRLCKPSPY